MTGRENTLKGNRLDGNRYDGKRCMYRSKIYSDMRTHKTIRLNHKQTHIPRQTESKTGQHTDNEYSLGSSLEEDNR